MVRSGPVFHIVSYNILVIVTVKVSSHVSIGKTMYMDQIGVLKRTIKIHVAPLSHF